MSEDQFKGLNVALKQIAIERNSIFYAECADLLAQLVVSSQTILTYEKDNKIACEHAKLVEESTKFFASRVSDFFKIPITEVAKDVKTISFSALMDFDDEDKDEK